MVKFVAVSLLTIMLCSNALAQSTIGEAQNRYRDGARMVDDGIEYISAASSTVFKVYYNLYVHPAQAAAMQLEEYDASYIQMKTKLVNQGRIICGRNKSVDECHLYYWTELSSIPPINVINEDDLAKSTGSYIVGVNIPETFKWESKVEDFGRIGDQPIDPQGAKFRAKPSEEKEENNAP